MGFWRVCLERFLNFVWRICHDFKMENRGKSRNRCFEERWTHYGVTIVYEAHRWPCVAGQQQRARWKKPSHSPSRPPPQPPPPTSRRRLRTSTHSRYSCRRGRFWWRRKCRTKYRGPWWRWPAVSISVTCSRVHDWASVDSDDTQWSDSTLCHATTAPQPEQLLDIDQLCYNSDSTLYNKMPVGFENSALKMSFSLSSLQPSSGSLESPEHARLRAERPYNSLTKKPRKDPEQETWRRSWGNRDDNKDEFWAALQSNYNYLMDNNLIESCKEASGELSWDEGDVSTNSYTWSFNEFLNQFSELYSWLNSIQEAVYGKEENVTDRNLRVSHMEEMQRKAYRRKLFNDQANKLLRRYPDVRDEVMWRMAHLNSKWEMLEQVITPCKSNPDQLDMCTDVEHEVRCLRKWIREMEARLEPLDFRVGVGWSLQELEEKAREHMVVQRDVESHGKIVCSVVKLCEKIARADPTTLGLKGHYDTAHACRVARSLERRWHHLYLRSLEWQCHLESLASKLRNNLQIKPWRGRSERAWGDSARCVAKLQAENQRECYLNSPS